MDEAFHDRERQFESKFAHDQEILFKARVHRDRLFAAWAAEKLGERAPPGFAATLVAFAFEKTPEAIIAKVAGELRAHGVDVPDGRIRRAFADCADRAREEVMNALPPEIP
jgi:hypothetical protein